METVHERMQRNMFNAVKLRTCDACQGNWFYRVTLNQFKAGNYSSMPGGEIISHEQSQPFDILICVCGKPFTPNPSGVRAPTATAAVSSLLESLKLAGEASATSSIRALSARLEKLSASVDALEAKAKATPAASAPRDNAPQSAPPPARIVTPTLSSTTTASQPQNAPLTGHQPRQNKTGQQ